MNFLGESLSPCRGAPVGQILDVLQVLWEVSSTMLDIVNKGMEALGVFNQCLHGSDEGGGSGLQTKRHAKEFKGALALDIESGVLTRIRCHGNLMEGRLGIS